MTDLKAFFHSGKTRPLAFRLKALERLQEAIEKNQDRIAEALAADLDKPRQEALVGEVALVIEEIRIARHRLKKWMRPVRAKTSLVLWPAKSRIYFEPRGLVLIISPWNYPVLLSLSPLVGAIAAGNCAVVKPSELTPKTSGLIAELIGSIFARDYCRVVVGGVDVTTALLAEKFDHIFFTGSTAVGKIVMSAAAKNLTPVTLELGGKSPAIVCDDSNLALAARRIAWGRFQNAGQTCVAPDYVYVHESVAPEFEQQILISLKEQFGDDPRKSSSYGRIVDARNVQRIAKLIETGKAICGGEVNAPERYIAPTVMTRVGWDSPSMQEEIFGPLLPVLTFKNLEEVYEILQSKAKPLAAYFFSNSRARQKEFIARVSFGGGVINDTVLHLCNSHFAFGGVGDSGMGSYHGFDSFKTFSHAKSILFKSRFLDLRARYAPYSESKTRFLARFFGLSTRNTRPEG